MTDPISEFLDAMGAAGIRPVEPIHDKLASGDPVRFRACGDKPGRRNGWAWLHLDDVPAGVFRHYRLGVRTVWRSGSDPRSLSPVDRCAIVSQARERNARRKAETIAKEEAAAETVRDLWLAASNADPAHGYLVRKGLPVLSIRQTGRHLLVPMVDSSFRLSNLQRIQPDGFKLFCKDARTVGLFWPHFTHMQDGSPSAGPLVIGEGFATMAAIHSATGFAVVAAMSVRNLEAVARAMRGRFPRREVILAADDDRHLSANLGLETAWRAAQAIGARVATPRPETCPARSSADFADIPRDRVAARITAARLGE